MLTQTALLSMASDDDHTFFNGLCGVLMGTAVLLIGIYMITRRANEPATDHPERSHA